METEGDKRQTNIVDEIKAIRVYQPGGWYFQRFKDLVIRRGKLLLRRYACLSLRTKQASHWLNYNFKNESFPHCFATTPESLSFRRMLWIFPLQGPPFLFCSEVEIEIYSEFSCRIVAFKILQVSWHFLSVSGKSTRRNKHSRLTNTLRIK